MAYVAQSLEGAPEVKTPINEIYNLIGIRGTLNQGGWVAVSLVFCVGLTTNFTGKLVVSALYRIGPCTLVASVEPAP